MTAPEPLPPDRDIVTVRDLSVDFGTARGRVHVLRHIDLAIPAGRIVGIVGESGSGKSTLSLAIMGLLPAGGHVVNGDVHFCGRSLTRLSEPEMRALRGKDIAMIFQDPMTSLNPVRSIGEMMLDVQYRDRKSSRKAKRRTAVEALRTVGIPDPDLQLDRYPYQFSGGMRQRIAIAMALLNRPALLIADEPTTALDVTLEAQILHLLRGLRAEIGGSILFISHNLGAIAEVSDDVAVFYAGEIVERGPVRDIFHDPRHPYTKALLDCDPARIAEASRQLPTIPGEVPSPARLPAGCAFASRCSMAAAECKAANPPLRSFASDRAVRCIRVEL